MLNIFKSGFCRILIFSFILSAILNAKDGAQIFKKKCANCHKIYIPVDKIKENLIKKNTVLHLKAPSVNMMAWAMLRGPKRLLGEDRDFLKDEVTDFLTEYLYNPNRENSLCDSEMLKYFDKKSSLKGKVSKEEIEALADFFIDYKPPKSSKKALKEKKEFDGDALLEKAQKTGKNILIIATSKSCAYCKKMKEEVLSNSEVKEFLQKNFLVKEVDIDSYYLPFELDNKGLTPAFFVIDANESIKAQAFGYIKKDEFLKGLNGVKK